MAALSGSHFLSLQSNQIMENKVRFATREDLPAILEIVNYNILNTTAIYDYAERSRIVMEEWFRDREQHNWPVIVAVQNGSVLGYGTYGTFRYKEGYKYTVEHSVYVSHEHTGKGIGKLVLAELIDIARSNGFHTMIGCIDAGNKGSIDFHKNFGFQESGILKQVAYKFDRWLDLQFMQLILK